MMPAKIWIRSLFLFYLLSLASSQKITFERQKDNLNCDVAPDKREPCANDLAEGETCAAGCCVDESSQTPELACYRPRVVSKRYANGFKFQPTKCVPSSNDPCKGTQRFLTQCRRRWGWFWCWKLRPCNVPCGPRWGPWKAWSACSNTCSHGQRSRSRSCVDQGGNVVSNSNCTGSSSEVGSCLLTDCLSYSPWANKTQGCSSNCTPGVIEQERSCTAYAFSFNPYVPSSCLRVSFPCNTDLCANYTQWGFCPCTSTCTPGMTFEMRRCLDGKTVPPGCDSKDLVPCNTDLCSEYSPWMTTACSSSCTPGVSMSTRYCNGTGCTNKACSVREVVQCNQDWCSDYSSWRPIGNCSSTCGGGMQTETRTCLTSGLSSPACLQRQVPCNQHNCPDSEINLDLSIIMASTDGVDDCQRKEIDLSLIPPFPPSVLLPGNFPNFLAQKNFIKELLTSWRTVGPQQTRISLQQSAGQCVSPNQNVHSVSNFDMSLSTTAIDDLSYLCGSSNPSDKLFCSITNQFTVANGERPDVRNAMLFLFGNTEDISAKMSIVQILGILKSAVVDPYGVTILTMSTQNLTALEPSVAASNRQFLLQFGCLEANPSPSCMNYVGTVHDGYSTVLQNIRNALDNTV